MPKLTDNQLVILSAALGRENRKVLPLPKNLRGGAAAKVVDALIAKGLVMEVEAQKNGPVWREDGEGRKLTLIATGQADTALEGGEHEPAPAAPLEDPAHSAPPWPRRRRKRHGPRPGPQKQRRSSLPRHRP